MWYHDNQGGHMSGGWGILAMILWLLVVTDLVLLGVWLWQKIQNKK
jgi:uncharacterized membrane protein